MPIPVRCSNCDKGLGIPDKYAGKTVKCPACKAPLKVPAAKSASGQSASDQSAAKPSAAAPPKRSTEGKPSRPSRSPKRKPQAVAAPGTDSDFLADLDLDRLDRGGEPQICPRCATELDDESSVCPECGFDAMLGEFNAKAVARKKSKGPLASEFYKESLPEARRFTWDSRLLVWKTAATWTVFGIGAGVSYRFLEYVQGLPTYIFWFCMTLLCVFAIAGWYWSLGAEVMKMSLARERAGDRLNVDYFATLALGIRAVLWPFIMGIPVWPVVFLALAIIQPGWRESLAVCIATYLLLYLLFPIAQVHAVQRYNYKASIFWELIRVVPKNSGPWLFTLAFYLLLAAPFAIAAYFIHTAGGGINPVSNEYVRSAGLWTTEKVGSLVDYRADSFFHPTVRRIAIFLYAIPLVGLFMTLAAFPAVFLMRLNGLFGLYNARKLDLVGKITPGTPATFWVRVLAGCVDAIGIPFASFLVVKEKLAVVLGQVLNFALFMIIWRLGRETARMFAPLWSIYMQWMYFAVSESTTARATIGKETYGLIVVPDAKEGEDPQQLGQCDLKLASKRFFFFLITSWIGLLTIPFRKDNKALCDMLSGTRVVWKGDR